MYFYSAITITYKCLSRHHKMTSIDGYNRLHFPYVITVFYNSECIVPSKDTGFSSELSFQLWIHPKSRGCTKSSCILGAACAI